MEDNVIPEQPLTDEEINEIQIDPSKNRNLLLRTFQQQLGCAPGDRSAQNTILLTLEQSNQLPFLQWNCACLAAVHGHDSLATSLVQHWHVPILPNLLHCAIWGNCESLVTWFLQRNAEGAMMLGSVFTPSLDGVTPLQLSESLGRIGITRKLFRFTSHNGTHHQQRQHHQQFSSYNIMLIFYLWWV